MVYEEVETSNKSEAFEIYKHRTVNYFKNIYANEVQNILIFIISLFG